MWRMLTLDSFWSAFWGDLWRLHSSGSSGSVVTLRGHNKGGGYGGGAWVGYPGSRSRGNGSGQFLGRGASGAWGPCKGHAVARSVGDGWVLGCLWQVPTSPAHCSLISRALRQRAQFNPLMTGQSNLNTRAHTHTCTHTHHVSNNWLEQQSRPLSSDV